MKYTTIVIDDSSIQRLATTFLAKNHPQLELVSSHANPYDGIKAIYEHKVDIVFLDVLMDNVDAFELMDSIEINAAVIMNSTWPRFAKPAFDYGINDFLTKPISKKRFEQSVTKIIAQIERRRAFQKERAIYQFSDIIKEAGRHMQPALIANHVFAMAQQFNGFYQNSQPRIKDDEDATRKTFRLALSSMVGRVINTGMDLLGIQVPDRM